MGKIIGIDLGTTNSVVAVMERGQPKVIPNTEGSRLTPSMVAFDEGGKVLVGEAARRRALVDPETTVVSAKRFIGLGANDPIVRRAPFKVVTAPGGDLAFEIFRVRHSPAEICARILTQLKRAADDYLGEPVTEAIISVPVSFDERQRQAIRDAGAIAGLEIKRIITEPIAVALAYGIRKTKEQLIAVCSMGGGAFEVSILEVGDKVVESVAGCGDNHLGGDDLDHRLIDWLVGEFRKDTSIDVGADKKVIQRLREAAERAKLELSERQETEIHLPALTVDASGPKHLQKTLSRAMFENLIEDLVERTIVSCRRALADAGKQVTDLHAVVLAGGSTRIPRVAARLEEFFGRKADRSMNADEAVALGAAIQAGILSGDLKDILLLDTTSLSLAIEVAGGVANVLIPRNTTIPTRKTELVSIPTAGHTAVSLHVIQGERPAAKDNTTIGRFQLIGLPSVPPGFLRPIEVTFDIDGNGVVHVAAKDAVTGLAETLRIGMPSAFGGDPRPAAAGTVAATLPRKDAINTRPVPRDKFGRLEDIVARNQKALRRPRNYFEVVRYIIEDQFGAQLDPKIRRHNFIALAVVIGLVAAMVGGYVWVRERESGIVLDRHGERVTVSDLWRGHRTLVVFFPDRTCDYCRKELLELNAHQVELAVSVIGVSSDKPAELERLRKDLDLSFELYSDAPLVLAKHWKIEIRGLQYSRHACETVLLVEPSGEPSYQSACTYPEVTAIIAATSRPPVHNQ